MSDQSNSRGGSADHAGQKGARPAPIYYVLAFLLLVSIPVGVIGAIGYGVWWLFFEGTPLEAALDPVEGNRAAWDAFIDDGGLNSDSRFHGLRIEKASVSFSDDGRITNVSMVPDKGVSAKDLRSALAEVCRIADSAWKISNTSLPGGLADGERCSVVYVEKNAEQWQLTYYRVSTPKASGPVSANDRACEESREAFVRQFTRPGISPQQAESMWYETHQSMKFADIDCREFARRNAGGSR